jgi:hypothetical protein
VTGLFGQKKKNKPLETELTPPTENSTQNNHCCQRPEKQRYTYRESLVASRTCEYSEANFVGSSAPKEKDADPKEQKRDPKLNNVLLPVLAG